MLEVIWLREDCSRSQEGPTTPQKQSWKDETKCSFCHGPPIYRTPNGLFKGSE